ncbi:DUF362 domain-containing protein [Puniceicoccales bacterium CK1056]|uniref:DUF362 domain-containing protein n=1 Tax=Oceanipulchritudo coccoides TaxID=2706888 RepID=A0A6B2M324_9BACT|nr:DUF362 domain-containing protein [Oceanipulchritudo coccoides]NDV62100.1 DUF362 domain-containing protein [Oceanipulchritudo coccoides]
MPLLAFLANADEIGFWGFESTAKRELNGKIWEVQLEDFSQTAYAREVQSLFDEFEKETGKRLAPGRQGKAALKVYTSSGAGLQTPPDLVRAVIEALLDRGFQREDLCLLDARSEMLRDAGFLPPHSRTQLLGPYFEGVRVYSLDRKELKSAVWYYDSPLPQEFTTPLGRAILGNQLELDPIEARKSYLPENLVTSVDFWINLPVACHHPSAGLSGALVNASLWNITNGTRFFNSPANAPVAVAEISSIPELQATWALNLISLESYQFIAGPAFNANYTRSLPELWLSVDPVVMDTRLIQLINKARREEGFEELPSIPEFIEYSIDLGLGLPFQLNQPASANPRSD